MAYIAWWAIPNLKDSRDAASELWPEKTQIWKTSGLHYLPRIEALTALLPSVRMARAIS